MTNALCEASFLLIVPTGSCNMDDSEHCCLQKGQSIFLLKESYAWRDSHSSPFHNGHDLIDCDENSHFGQRLWLLSVKSLHAKCSIGPVWHWGHWCARLERDKYKQRISLACVALVSMIRSTHDWQSFCWQQETLTKSFNGAVSAHMEQTLCIIFFFVSSCRLVSCRVSVNAQ